MDVEFVGQSARDATAISANTSRLLNLYREPVTEGGITRHLLRPVPGRAQVADLGGAFLRRMAWVDGTVFAARGGELYEIDSMGGFTSLGAVSDDAETDISGNTGSVTVVSGGRYYVWDGVSLTQPAAGAFSNFGSVTSLNNYTLLTERNGRKIQWSDLADPKTLDGLSFATTESRDDKNIRGVVIGGQYWVFKQRSYEVWYNTGLSGAEAFARVAGGVRDTGLKAFGLICKARDAAFFIGSDNVAYLTDGNGVRPVSSRPVEIALRDGTATACFYYEQDGHKFCVIRFSDRPSWVLDIATTEWHERSEGRLHQAWGAVDAVEAGSGVFWVGSIDGKISELRPIATDNGDAMHRRAVSLTYRMDSERFRAKAFEIFGAYGWATGETNLMVSFSRDGGATWGNERFVSMGAQGEYEKRAQMRNLGQFRRMTAQVDITGAYGTPIYSTADLDLA